MPDSVADGHMNGGAGVCKIDVLVCMLAGTRFLQNKIDWLVCMLACTRISKKSLAGPLQLAMPSIVMHCATVRQRTRVQASRMHGQSPSSWVCVGGCILYMCYMP